MDEAAAAAAARMPPGTPLVPIRLTHDHHPGKPEERMRIEASGGIVRRSRGGKYRLEGELELSRSFGDFGYHTKGLIPDPDFMAVNFTENDVVLVLASDGLFEVMEAEELCLHVWAEWAGDESVGLTPPALPPLALGPAGAVQAASSVPSAAQDRAGAAEVVANGQVEQCKAQHGCFDRDGRVEGEVGKGGMSTKSESGSTGGLGEGGDTGDGLLTTARAEDNLALYCCDCAALGTPTGSRRSVTRQKVGPGAGRKPSGDVGMDCSYADWCPCPVTMQQAAAARLVNEAYNRQSMDNLAVLVIDLQGAVAAAGAQHGAAKGTGSSSSSSHGGFAGCSSAGREVVDEHSERKHGTCDADVPGDREELHSIKGCLNNEEAAGVVRGGDGDDEVFEDEREVHGVRSAFGVPLYTLESLDDGVLQSNCGLFEAVVGEGDVEAEGDVVLEDVEGFVHGHARCGDGNADDIGNAGAGGDRGHQIASVGVFSSCPIGPPAAAATAPGVEKARTSEQSCPARDDGCGARGTRRGGGGMTGSRGSASHPGLILWCKELSHHYQIASHVADAPLMPAHVHLHVAGTGDASLQR